MIANTTTWQWILIAVTSILFFIFSPLARNKRDFFRGSERAKPVNTWLLTSSLVISWIFAKSISNAANLGRDFGLPGGLAYAAYYLSFLVAGIVLVSMRVNGKFKSIHHFLNTRYGRSAVVLFSVLIAFRLFNEVWSNTMVIGSYFGPRDSGSYYLAIIVFTLTTLAYVLKGGLRSSLWTDLVQMLLFAVLLVVVLGVIIPRTNDPAAFLTSGEWTFSGGLNLLLVALVQVMSYPFHDPVLTDRGFIAKPAVTRKSFFLATLIGIVCITLFSFVGIYARTEGLPGTEAAFEVSRSLGPVMMLIMNIIMITSATSTLDSTFSSFSKLAVADLGLLGKVTLSKGRLAMAVLTLLGTIPVFFSPEILSATTISGTMVIGLAPVFLLWKLKAPAWTFYWSVSTGLLAGLLFALGLLPASWTFFPGKYGDLLSVNLVGTALCFLVYFTGILWKRNNPT